MQQFDICLFFCTFLHKTWICCTIYARSRQLQYVDNPDANSINHAMKYMRQNLHRSLPMEDIAAHSGIGYSKFRKVFKDYSGFAPAQFRNTTTS